MPAFGPKRQFAAVQRYGHCRRNTGRSVDVANTAAPDPLRSCSASSVGTAGPENAMSLPCPGVTPSAPQRASR
jgi:hypothetical protein